MKVLGRFVLALAAIVLAAGHALAEPRPLSENDESAYRSAFNDVRRGEFTGALERVSRVSDRVLMGQLQFEILFHRDYAASFAELAAWLDQYGDLPVAPRVYALAMRRRPLDAPEPRAPEALVAARAWQAASGLPELREREPRHQLNDGYVQRAWEAGQIMGDYWVAGMAAYRLGRFEDAFSAFERVAIDPSETGWIRAGAGYWAARSLTQANRALQAQDWLRLAARWPHTFYGQIAMRQLGLEPLVLNAPWLAAREVTVVDAPPVDEAAAEAFAAASPRARRAAALTQIGRRDDALAELHAGVMTADTAEARLAWATLGESLSARLGVQRSTVIDAADYAMPELQPQGGFTLPRGLVYAIARKETRFNPQARSSVGAYGLMQVMPATAAELSGNAAFRRDPTLLFDPAINMRLGQDYIHSVLSMDAIQGDLLRSVVAYNGGPRPVIEARRALGPDADSLLIIENIPVSQSRQYVEEVIAVYWIYQRLWQDSLATLGAAAAGSPVIHAALDPPPPPPPPPVVVEPAATPPGETAVETAAVQPATAD